MMKFQIVLNTLCQQFKIRAKTYNNFYYIGEFKKSALKVDKDTLLKYERLKKIICLPQLKEMLF